MGIEERINPDAWRQYLQSLQSEIPELQERIGLLRPQLDKALTESKPVAGPLLEVNRSSRWFFQFPSG